MAAGLGASSGELGQSVLPVAAVVPMMGINPMQFKEWFHILYSVYAAHIGYCKETSCIATQHVIQDLWEEAAMYNAVSPPLPIMPAITVNTINSALTIL